MTAGSVGIPSLPRSLSWVPWPRVAGLSVGRADLYRGQPAKRLHPVARPPVGGWAVQNEKRQSAVARGRTCLPGGRKLVSCELSSQLHSVSVLDSRHGGIRCTWDIGSVQERHHVLKLSAVEFAYSRRISRPHGPIPQATQVHICPACDCESVAGVAQHLDPASGSTVTLDYASHAVGVIHILRTLRVAYTSIPT